MHAVLRSLTAIAPAIALAAVVPGVAGADTTIKFSRAVTADGVRPGAIAPATMSGRTLSLPVSRARGKTVTHAGGLRLRAGRRSVDVRSVRTQDSKLSGRIAGVRRNLAKISGTRLTLTRPGARRLERALGRELPRHLGSIKVDRSAPPPASQSLTITGGEVVWGYNPGIRDAFQLAFPPVLSGGATQSADNAFHLPVTSGRYDLTTRTGSVTTTGGFRIGYQLRPSDAAGAHGMWVSIWNVELALEGDRGTLRASSESGYHGSQPVAATIRTIATLDLRGITPRRSADGSTLTWPAIPATIAPGGEELVAAFLPLPDRPSLGDTKALDPVTIVARVTG